MMMHRFWMVGPLAAAVMMACGDSGVGTSGESDSASSRGTSGGGETAAVPTGSDSEAADGTRTGSDSATDGVTPPTTGGPGSTSGVGGTSDTTASGGETASSDGSAGTASTGADPGTGTGTSAGGASTGEGETGDGTTGALSFCEGEGGILLPGDGQCTGDLGEKTFVFALCSCTDVSVLGTFMTDSFNSNDPNLKVMAGGSVGVNGNYNTTAVADIGGALWIDGAMGTTAIHGVAKDLQCGGNVTPTLVSTVDEDAYVEGNISGLLPLMTIAGDLHIPNGKTVQAAVDGQIIKEAVDVQTPCDCSDPIDIAGIVAGFKSDNDNAANGVDPEALADLGLIKNIELPCGRYYFTEITSLLALTITVTGRTVIAVEGDLTDVGIFDLEIAPGAELDLFVAGDIEFANLAALGDKDRPAALRIYAAGDVTFVSGFQLGGNLYAPNAIFNSVGLGDVWGSLFVKGIQLIELFAIHYDAAVLDQTGCLDPGGECGDCHDCLNPTPKCGDDGECLPCEVDADCCPPFQCDDGQCWPQPG
mgnify:CR=1 FL=1